MIDGDLFQAEAPVNDNVARRVTRKIDYVADTPTELKVRDPEHPELGIITLAKSAIDWAWARGARVEVTIPQRLAREKGIA